MTANNVAKTECVLEGYMTVREAAQLIDRSESLVRKLCSGGRIEGVVKIGTNWLIPKNAILHYTPGPKGFTVMWERIKAELSKNEQLQKVVEE